MTRSFVCFVCEGTSPLPEKQKHQTVPVRSLSYPYLK